MIARQAYALLMATPTAEPVRGRAYEAICSIKKRVNGMGIRNLLEEVYAAHPEYAQYRRYEF